MKIYNKLVRDRIPEIIEASGKTPVYRMLSEEEYKQALKDKLLEEVNEFLAADTKEEIIEELGDIQVVCVAILTNLTINMDLYSDLTMKKFKEKGGFIKRYFLEKVEDD